MNRHNFSGTLFEVDWNDFNDVKKLFKVVKSRYIELDPEKRSQKVIQKDLLESCFNIWETDISDIYYGLNLSEEREYYVYCHCNPDRKLLVKKARSAFAASIGLNSVPFYVGKGKGDRAYNTNRSETHRKIKQHLQARSKEIDIVLVKEGLTEIEALCYESKLIDIFGLIPYKGWLTNLDEGHLKDERRNKYFDDFKKLCPASITDWD